MRRYSVPSVPPHLDSSKARALSVSAIGLWGPGVINFERGGICTTSLEMSPKVSRLLLWQKIVITRINKPKMSLQQPTFFLLVLFCGPSPKKSRKKAAKAKPGDAAPTLTKNTVKKAVTKKKAAKKATGKAKK